MDYSEYLEGGNIDVENIDENVLKKIEEKHFPSGNIVSEDEEEILVREEIQGTDIVEDEESKYYDLEMVPLNQNIRITEIQRFDENAFAVQIKGILYQTPSEYWEYLSEIDFKAPFDTNFGYEGDNLFADANKSRLKEIKKFSGNLVDLLSWFFKKSPNEKGKFQTYTDEVIKMLKEGKEDEVVYKRIMEILKDFSNSSGIRSNKKFGEVMEVLPDFEPNENFIFLDVGCKDGSLIEAMKENLKIDGKQLEYDQLYGIDVEIPNYVTKEELQKKFNFYDSVEYKGNKLPSTMIEKLAGKKIHLVTALAVLHHVNPEDLDPLLKDIYDNMETGGFFVIREHDCQNKLLIPVIDAEHVIYATIGNNPEKTYEKFMKDNPRHTGNYKSSKTWDEIMAKAGFKRIQLMTSFIDVANNFRTHMYYAGYQK